jgi:hypothetical protein
MFLFKSKKSLQSSLQDDLLMFFKFFEDKILFYQLIEINALFAFTKSI